LSLIKWAESIVLKLPLRIALGGAFCYAAWMKLNDVQSFAEAIKGFKVVNVDTHEHLIVIGAYTMPWVEMIAGVLLALGLFTRAASATIALLLIAFMAALMHVIFDDSISADCSCFGDVKLVCGSSVGWCQVIRDLVMLVPCVYLIWRGGGHLSLDMLFKKHSNHTDSADSVSQDVNLGSNTDQQVDDSGIRA
jgi:putative oxidoreductase